MHWDLLPNPAPPKLMQDSVTAFKTEALPSRRNASREPRLHHPVNRRIIQNAASHSGDCFRFRDDALPVVEPIVSRLQPQPPISTSTAGHSSAILRRVSFAASSFDLPPLPEAVTSFGATILGDAIYVFGGHQGERHQYYQGAASGALHRLRIHGGRDACQFHWESLAGHVPAQGTALVARGNSLYRVGGMSARNAKTEKSELHSQSLVARFDVDAGSWSDFVSLPEPRSSHDAIVLDDTLYVAGGWTLAGVSSGATWRDSLLRIRLTDPAPRWEIVPQPFRRRALAIAGLGDQLYCLGGIDDEGETPVEVMIFHTQTGTWSKGPDLPKGPMNGFGGSAVAHRGCLYFSGLKGDLLQLDPVQQNWRVVDRLRHARFFHRLLPLGPSQCVAVGGESGDGKRQDLEVLMLGIP